MSKKQIGSAKYSGDLLHHEEIDLEIQDEGKSKNKRTPESQQNIKHNKPVGSFKSTKIPNKIKVVPYNPEKVFSKLSAPEMLDASAAINLNYDPNVITLDDSYHRSTFDYIASLVPSLTVNNGRSKNGPNDHGVAHATNVILKHYLIASLCAENRLKHNTSNVLLFGHGSGMYDPDGIINYHQSRQHDSDHAHASCDASYLCDHFNFDRVYMFYPVIDHDQIVSMFRRHSHLHKVYIVIHKCDDVAGVIHRGEIKYNHSINKSGNHYHESVCFQIAGHTASYYQRSFRWLFENSSSDFLTWKVAQTVGDLIAFSIKIKTIVSDQYSTTKGDVTMKRVSQYNGEIVGGLTCIRDGFIINDVDSGVQPFYLDKNMFLYVSRGCADKAITVATMNQWRSNIIRRYESLDVPLRDFYLTHVQNLLEYAAYTTANNHLKNLLFLNRNPEIVEITQGCNLYVSHLDRIISYASVIVPGSILCLTGAYYFACSSPLSFGFLTKTFFNLAVNLIVTNTISRFMGNKFVKPYSSIHMLAKTLCAANPVSCTFEVCYDLYKCAKLNKPLTIKQDVIWPAGEWWVPTTPVKLVYLLANVYNKAFKNKHHAGSEIVVKRRPVPDEPKKRGKLLIGLITPHLPVYPAKDEMGIWVTANVKSLVQRIQYEPAEFDRYFMFIKQHADLIFNTLLNPIEPMFLDIEECIAKYPPTKRKILMHAHEHMKHTNELSYTRISLFVKDECLLKDKDPNEIAGRPINNLTPEANVIFMRSSIYLMGQLARRWNPSFIIKFGPGLDNVILGKIFQDWYPNYNKFVETDGAGFDASQHVGFVNAHLWFLQYFQCDTRAIDFFKLMMQRHIHTNAGFSYKTNCGNISGSQFTIVFNSFIKGTLDLYCFHRNNPSINISQILMASQQIISVPRCDTYVNYHGDCTNPEIVEECHNPVPPISILTTGDDSVNATNLRFDSVDYVSVTGIEFTGKVVENILDITFCSALPVPMICAVSSNPIFVMCPMPARILSRLFIIPFGKYSISDEIPLLRGKIIGLLHIMQPCPFMVNILNHFLAILGQGRVIDAEINIHNPINYNTRVTVKPCQATFDFWNNRYETNSEEIQNLCKFYKLFFRKTPHVIIYNHHQYPNLLNKMHRVDVCDWSKDMSVCDPTSSTIFE